MSGLKNVRNRLNDSLSQVRWDNLEVLVASYYFERGYQVEHVGTGGTGARFDGGIDLKLRKDDQYILVQCKHWNAKQVPHNAVHELLGIMVNQGATGAILVTSGEFTKAAIEAATRQGHVQLIDGEELRAMLGPIDEPRTSTSGFFEATRPVAAHVGERLLLAAEDRIRGHRGYGPRRGGLVRSAWGLLLLKIVLPVVLMMGVVLLVLTAIQHTILGMQPVVTTHAQPANLPTPVESSPRAVTQMPVSATEAPMIAPAKVLPAAERREQKRRQEEELRQLKENTPEM